MSNTTVNTSDVVDSDLAGPSHSVGDSVPAGPPNHPTSHAPPPRRAPQPRRLGAAQGRLDARAGSTRSAPTATAAMPAGVDQGSRRQRAGDELVYVMPWERPPGWLDLPHLQPVGVGFGGSHDERREDEVSTDAGRGDTAPGSNGCAAGPIRGRELSPGTRNGAQHHRSGLAHGDAPAEIRGPDEGLGRAGGAVRSRAQARLDARNAHLQESLALHAERVRRRRERDPPTTTIPSAMERMAALRRRVTAKAAGMQKADVMVARSTQDGDGSPAGGGELVEVSTQREAGRSALEFTAAVPSNEDVNMHYNFDIPGAAVGDAALGGGASGNADTAAAARTVAWHSGASGPDRGVS